MISLNIVVGEALAELGDVAGLVLLLIEAGDGGVQGGACDQVLLPGDLVGGVGLALRAGAEAHAGDAVAALDGHAVGGEGPLVRQGAAPAQVHGVPLGVGVLVTDALLAPQAVVGVDEGLDVGGGLLVDPGGEEALGLIDLAGPGGPVVHVHGDLHVVAVLLHAGQLPDLLQAGVPGLPGGHAPVDGDGAAVRHRAAGGRGVEDLADGAGATAQELGVLIVLRVELRIQHLHQAFDRVGGTVAALIQGPDVLEDVGHLVDGVVPPLGGGAVAGDALHVQDRKSVV